MNFRDDRRKKFTTWQIVKLEMKIQVKPVKASATASILQIAVYLCDTIRKRYAVNC